MLALGRFSKKDPTSNNKKWCNDSVNNYRTLLLQTKKDNYKDQLNNVESKSKKVWEIILIKNWVGTKKKQWH